MSSSVAVLLAFANDWMDDKRHLRSLLDESKAIGGALASLVESGLILAPPILNATVDDVIGTFRRDAYRDRIRIFHFGGHANGSALLFEDRAGNAAEAHAHGLAGYLGQQRGLVLVFLNGCGTEPQVRRLREAGVKAVVATTQSIQDRVAAEFATEFYSELVARPLREAFEAAVHAIQTRRGEDPRSVMRDVVVTSQGEPLRWPWMLDCEPAFDTWTLRSQLRRGMESRRPWVRSLLIAAATMLFVIVASLVAGATARRVVCRTPGLRARCSATGIGDVLAPAEKQLWDEARKQRSGDGLRAYLREYPDGVYARDARARLAGCGIERSETLGPERTSRYPWTVRRASPFATEEAARRDAVSRGNRDAADACEPLARTAALLSAVAIPGDWHCQAVEGDIACGFDGELHCRVRDRIVIEAERCRNE